MRQFKSRFLLTLFRCSLALLFWLCTVAVILAQNSTYGNEWINYQQPYFKINVLKAGIYRLTKTQLDGAGLPTGGLAVKSYRVYRKGVEIPLVSDADANTPLSNNNYLDFYAEPANGKADAALYINAGWQPHTLTSLFSDTSAYFLTYNTTAPGLRMQLGPAVITGAPLVTSGTATATVTANAEYSAGRGYFDLDGNIHSSLYDKGEGFTGTTLSSISAPFSGIYNFQGLQQISNTANTAQLIIILAGRNGRPHTSEISISANGINFTPIDTLRWDKYFSAYSTKQIPSGLLTNGNLQVRIRPLSGQFPDLQSFSAATLTYNCGFQLNTGVNTFSCNISGGNGGVQNFNFISASVIQPRVFDITDPLQPILLQSLSNGNLLTSAITNLNNAKVLLTSDVTEISSGNIRKVAFRNINPLKHNYLVISNPSLYKPAGGYNDVVRGYLDYRASVAGGRYDTLLTTAADLYNLFNYGDVSPMAIRQFARYMLDNGVPKYLFLLGKAINLAYRFDGAPDRNFQVTNLVPTYGVPGSDVVFTVGLAGSGAEPAIPTGRLSAKSAADIAVYLNKVKQHEALGYTDLWRKNILQLSGGKTGGIGGEQAQFKGYIDNLKGIAEGRQLGGKATNYYRRQNSIVEFIDVTPQFNKGCSMVTIFGHSSLSGPDVDIGNPNSNDFSNIGKYPLLMINGCLAGELYGYDPSFNDQFVFADNKGAIGMLGNVDEGFSDLLYSYVSKLYSAMWVDTAGYGYGLGKQQQLTIKKYVNNASSIFDTILSDQFTLHADPAVVMFGAKKPDYAINSSAISVAEKIVTANSASFTLIVPVANYGKAVKDSLVIGITRTYPDGTKRRLAPYRLKSVYNADTFSLVVPQRDGLGGGINTFEIKVDFYDSIPELNEGNNTATFTYQLPLSGVVSIFPKKYSIVNSPQVTFQAQNSDLFSASRNFFFELDTSSLFTSGPSVKRNSIVSGKALATWQTTLPVLSDSTVYYWRVKYAETLSPSDTAFSTSTFLFINNGPEGWSQSKFPQFSEVKLDGLLPNPSQALFDFPPTSITISGNVSGNGKTSLGPNPATADIKINGTSLFYSPSSFCWNNDDYGRLLCMRFRGNTLAPYLFPYGNDTVNYYKYACGREPMSITFFRNSFLNLQISSGSIYSDDAIRYARTGDWVMLMSVGRVDFQNWTHNQYAQLALIGVDTVKFKQFTVDNPQFVGSPYLVIGQKGSLPGTAYEVRPDLNSGVSPNQQSFAYSKVLTTQSNYGTITSPRIGPATIWYNAVNTFRKREINGQDNYKIDVITQKANGADSILLAGMTGSNIDLSNIDAAKYPYINLRATLQDLTPTATPLAPVLKKWQVFYKGVPEGFLNTSVAGSSSGVLPDMPEGQTFKLKYTFQNISGRDFADSLLVQTTVFNENGGGTSVYKQKIKALKAKDTSSFTTPQITTVGKAGANTVQVFVNPQIQPEEYYTNNFINIPLNVKADKSNPLLDVTFDGRKIMNGEIVSPSPAIALVLKDDNKYLLKGDTTGLLIYLKQPCQNCIAQRINFTDSRIRFSPATAASPLRIDFSPQNLADGTYTLRAQGSDASGNKSGSIDYSIDFQVINASTVTHFFPYPNPFSTSTKFVFTLTGADVPDDIKIQIMTVTGKVIREISKAELGPIRIGNNITNFSWTGTDQFGDKLANGVYLYRVLMRNKNGAAPESRATEADNTFRNGFGKMYILR